jgi:hypothetical protein
VAQVAHHPSNPAQPHQAQWLTSPETGGSARTRTVAQTPVSKQLVNSVRGSLCGR